MGHIGIIRNHGQIEFCLLQEAERYARAARRSYLAHMCIGFSDRLALLVQSTISGLFFQVISAKVSPLSGSLAMTPPAGSR